MRATLTSSLCLLLAGVATGVCAEPTSSVPGAVSLGKPVVVRGQEPDADAAPAPRSLPTLGKPVVGRPEISPSAPAAGPASPGAPALREPAVFVNRRPEPLAADTKVQPASFMTRPGATSVENQPPPPEPEPEPLPMPRPRPGIMPPAGVIVGPDLTGPVSPGHEVVHAPKMSLWDRLKYGVHDSGGWAPSEVQHGPDFYTSPSVLCPDMCCTDPCCAPQCHTIYGSVEYLLWKLRDLDVPPLVTTTTNPAEEIGAIGQPSTRILYGGEIDQGSLSGIRLSLGMWLDPCHTIALDGSFFWLEDGEDSFFASSDAQGNPLLARPFLDQFDGLENVELISDPGVLAGAVSVTSRTRFWGAELNLRTPLVENKPWCCWCKSVYLLGGFRYLNLEDEIAVREKLNTLAPVDETPAGTLFSILDRFESRNEFYGGQIGLDTRLCCGRWVIDVRDRLALGVTHQEVGINGFTIEQQPGLEPTFRPGGLLTQSTNIGNYSRDRFSMVNEFGVTLGYQLTCRTRIFAGYQGLYWSNVARADQQIDRVVNRQLLSGGTGEGTRPAFSFRERDFWAHGLNAGVEIKY